MADEAKQAEKTKPLIVIVYHSIWGHIRTLAEEIEKGVKEAGCDVAVYQVQETLPDEVIKKMYGKSQSEYADKHPILTRDKLADVLTNADGILFGTGTRFGMMSAQTKSLFDNTGGLWMKGALIGKPAGIFFSTGCQNGGQETTALTAVTQLTHHGMMFVPIGYGCADLKNNEEVHGGGPYGAGTIAGPNGERQPSDLEKRIAQYQGKYMGGVVTKLFKGSK
eukprot:CAMPEP_0202685920 /NCGR_PEP_ID=MMETSP1385-20130828/1733_1 /ASSEMBLY_ACC=CAM_ASM_000861 /TAXON_ID=933848 /ORGANISM="Elphidium margaritaceum" /LENGTH=221 /DNA_ID=CAMNT_0049340393 /DNA_START=111 /DNA_END=776 /DNA_ORIENTATION=+